MSFVAADQTRRQVVGVAELKVSARPGDLLVTYALGSCLGVAVWDPTVKVGGLLHCMLPSGSEHEELASRQPARFVDTGVVALFQEAYRLGARKERMLVKVAGGASVIQQGQADSFQIGKRNILALRKLLWKNGVFIHREDLGGHWPRTMSLDVGTGEVRIRCNGSEYVL